MFVFHLRWGRLPDELHFARLPGLRHRATVVVQRLHFLNLVRVRVPRTPLSNTQPSFGLNGYIKRVIRGIGICAREARRSRDGESSRRGTHIEVHRDNRSGAFIERTQVAGDRVALSAAPRFVRGRRR